LGTATIYEAHLPAAAKYIEMNPARANLTPDPYDWRWSSAKAHADGIGDILVKVSPLLQMVGDWKLFLRDFDEEDVNKIRGHERTGRALGSDWFLESLELSSMRAVKQRKAGRKKKADKEERCPCIYPQCSKVSWNFVVRLFPFREQTPITLI